MGESGSARGEGVAPSRASSGPERTGSFAFGRWLRKAKTDRAGAFLAGLRGAGPASSIPGAWACPGLLPAQCLSPVMSGAPRPRPGRPSPILPRARKRRPGSVAPCSRRTCWGLIRVVGAGHRQTDRELGGRGCPEGLACSPPASHPGLPKIGHLSVCELSLENSVMSALEPWMPALRARLAASQVE